MKRMQGSSQLFAFFLKAGLVAVLAAVLLAPTTINVIGSEAGSRVERARPMIERSTPDVLPLQPIQYLETTPWLVCERAPEVFKFDTLLEPEFELLQSRVATSESCDFATPSSNG
jgi:hypothetical protein